MLLPLFLNVVFLSEPLDPSGSINEFLFAGKEGVAGGANFHLDAFDGGTGLDYIPAGAGNSGHLVFGMNFLSHIQILQCLSNSEAALRQKPV
jgi:hypothetical protein